MNSITSGELQRVCRAWEMNNGYDGWEEFVTSFKYYIPQEHSHHDWVIEKSLHKSYLNHGWKLIEWLLKKSEA
jgi:hypothetical protein